MQEMVERPICVCGKRMGLDSTGRQRADGSRLRRYLCSSCCARTTVGERRRSAPSNPLPDDELDDAQRVVKVERADFFILPQFAWLYGERRQG